MRLLLHENIEKLRAERGWSQETLAAKAGVSRGTIGNYVGQKTVPNVVDAWKIADVLGVTLDELVGRTPLRGAGAAAGRIGSLPDVARAAGMSMQELLEELVTELARERERTTGRRTGGREA